MNELEETMVEFCRKLRQIQTHGMTPDVEFRWDFGVAFPLTPTKVPTLTVRCGPFETTCDHEGKRHEGAGGR